MKSMITICIVFLATSFQIKAQSEMLLLTPNGKVVIGDTSLIDIVGNYNLYVQNGMLTERVKVALRSESQWSDGAFNHTPTLKQVEDKITRDSHLPGMPSAAELVKEGYEMVFMDAKLLAQIEWLWQHSIAIKKENDLLKQELETLKKAVAELAAKK